VTRLRAIFSSSPSLRQYNSSSTSSHFTPSLKRYRRLFLCTALSHIYLIALQIMTMQDLRRTNGLPPILWMPEEIVETIFSLGKPVILDEFATLRPNETKKLYHHLLTVTAVCRSWRQTAIQSPRLWSTIFILFNRTKQNHLHYIPLVRMFLQRSKSCLLSIRVKWVSHGSTFEDSEEAVLMTLWSLLRQQSSRFEHLYYHHFGYMPSRGIYPFPTLVNLKTLSLRSMCKHEVALVED
jgi:hypothetical protein